MKCERCGQEAVMWEKHPMREASGSEATVRLVFNGQNGTITINVCSDCAPILQLQGWSLPSRDFDKRMTQITSAHNEEREAVFSGLIDLAPVMARCVGCRWRMPQRMGGEGILCLQKNGDCPAWAIKWALMWAKNGHGKPVKSFVTDEDLLEAMRL